MTNEEALKEMQLLRNGAKFNQHNYTMQAFNMAIEALDKQITYKGEDIVTTDNEWVGIRCKCGIGVPYLMRFCPKCGQAIDWSEVE